MQTPVQPPGLTDHAVDMYRIHHPRAEREDVLSAVLASTPVDEKTAGFMAGRNREPTHKAGGPRNAYRVAPDRKGLFALSVEGNRAVVVTYLRFQQSQQDYALKWWPPEHAPSAPPPPSPQRSSVERWAGRELRVDPTARTPLRDLWDQYARWATADAADVPTWVEVMRSIFPNEWVDGTWAFGARLGGARVVAAPAAPAQEPRPVPAWKAGRPVGRKDRFAIVRGEYEPVRWEVRLVEGGRPRPGPANLPSKEAAVEAALAAGGPVYSSHECVDCGEIAHHDFMVRNEVWRAAGMTRGRLHLWCLEERLGRDLALEDFTEAPINDAILFGYRKGLEAR